MKAVLKGIVIIIVIILVTSSLYFVTLIGNGDSEGDSNPDIKPDDKEGNDNNDDNDDGGEENPNEDGPPDYSNYVLIEEATQHRCEPCVHAAEVLHNLHENNYANFFYVSMVQDRNQKASDYLFDYYNLYAYPSLYIDGGYRIQVGASEDTFENSLKNHLSEAFKRQKHEIYLEVISEWNETRKDLTNSIYIENLENDSYSGKLKIFITEINSRWTTKIGTPYHYSFLDFASNQDITLNGKENKSFSGIIWNADDAGFSDVEHVNLFVIAALYNSEYSQGYSNPGENENPFNAYYVDNVNATRVSEGKLPPTIGIVAPSGEGFYLFGNEIGKSFSGNTVLIGKVTVKLDYVAESGLDKIELTITKRDKTRKVILTEAPFEWRWDIFSLGKCKIVATIYDKDGRTDNEELEVYAFTILGKLRYD